jgi:hypothetical protein
MEATCSSETLIIFRALQRYNTHTTPYNGLKFRYDAFQHVQILRTVFCTRVLFYLFSALESYTIHEVWLTGPDSNQWLSVL